MTVSPVLFSGAQPDERFQYHSPIVNTAFTSTERKTDNPNPEIPRYDLQDMLDKAQEVSGKHNVRVKVKVYQDLGTYYYYPDGKGGAKMGSTGAAPNDHFVARFSTAKGTPEQHFESYEDLRKWSDSLYPAINPNGGGDDGSSWIA